MLFHLLTNGIVFGIEGFDGSTARMGHCRKASAASVDGATTLGMRTVEKHGETWRKMRKSPATDINRHHLQHVASRE